MTGNGRQKISKNIEDLNDTTNQDESIDMYRILHPTRAEHTFFSIAHQTFTTLDQILHHNAKFSKFEIIEII